MRGLHKSDVRCICTCTCAHLLRTMVPPRPARPSLIKASYWFKGEISVCAAQPDPTHPDPITLLRSLYLSNGLTDSRVVFFVRCHHSINFIFDRHRYPPVPATARGTCQGEDVGDTLSIGYSMAVGPIVFKFCVCLETS